MRVRVRLPPGVEVDPERLEKALRWAVAGYDSPESVWRLNDVPAIAQLEEATFTEGQGDLADLYHEVIGGLKLPSNVGHAGLEKATRRKAPEGQLGLWAEEDHPRQPKGAAGGKYRPGEFVPKGQAGGQGVLDLDSEEKPEEPSEAEKLIASIRDDLRRMLARSREELRAAWNGTSLDATDIRYKTGALRATWEKMAKDWLGDEWAEGLADREKLRQAREELGAKVEALLADWQELAARLDPVERLIREVTAEWQAMLDRSTADMDAYLDNPQDLPYSSGKAVKAAGQVDADRLAFRARLLDGNVDRPEDKARLREARYHMDDRTRALKLEWEALAGAAENNAFLYLKGLGERRKQQAFRYLAAVNRIQTFVTVKERLFAGIVRKIETDPTAYSRQWLHKSLSELETWTNSRLADLETLRNATDNKLEKAVIEAVMVETTDRINQAKAPVVTHHDKLNADFKAHFAAHKYSGEGYDGRQTAKKASKRSNRARYDCGRRLSKEECAARNLPEGMSHLTDEEHTRLQQRFHLRGMFYYMGPDLQYLKQEAERMMERVETRFPLWVRQRMYDTGHRSIFTAWAPYRSLYPDQESYYQAVREVKEKGHYSGHYAWDENGGVHFGGLNYSMSRVGESNQTSLGGRGGSVNTESHEFAHALDAKLRQDGKKLSESAEFKAIWEEIRHDCPWYYRDHAWELFAEGLACYVESPALRRQMEKGPAPWRNLAGYFKRLLVDPTSASGDIEHPALKKGLRLVLPITGAVEEVATVTDRPDDLKGKIWKPVAFDQFGGETYAHFWVPGEDRDPAEEQRLTGIVVPAQRRWDEEE